jgi:Asp-tRNA(Asn)/Glu-tRNA(Gln) amidotransferase A subunit family amidase
MSISAAYDDSDALGLAALVRSGEVRADELLDEALRRVDQRNPAVNALTTVFEARARAQIAAGLPTGPLAGVPFLLKDLATDLAGEVTTNGSRFFRDSVATETSFIVERYLAAGLVVFGKTTTPELGLNASTEPVLTGPTRNPWDLQRSAGGSSGGAGAAVAAGIVPAAHATDGGGSIRIPASCNGLFGLKPSRGRTPSGPPEGDKWNGLSVGHAVTRTVRDSAALLDAVSGPTAGEPYASPAVPTGGFLQAMYDDPGTLRIGVARAGRPGVGVDADCLVAVDRAAALLEELGHHVEEVTLPLDWAQLLAATSTIVSCHVAATIADRAAAVGRAPGPEDLEAMARMQLALAEQRRGVDYVEAVRTIQRAGRAMGRLLTDVDLVLTPTLGTVPLPLGELDADTDDIASFGARAGRVAQFLGVANATGQPAMSVPLHWTDDGLPVGVQFLGRLGAEAMLLALAHRLEEAAPWRDRRPAGYASGFSR